MRLLVLFRRSSSDPAAAVTHVDPVCGAVVNPLLHPFWAERDGRDYHFCSADCQTRFRAIPGLVRSGRN